jgi:hypothetical protein
MQRTEKKDNFAKTFDKKIGQEEQRLLRLLDEEEHQRYIPYLFNVMRRVPSYS